MTLPKPPTGGSGRGSGSRERSYLRYLHLGTQMVVTMLLGLFGGMWLDDVFGTEPALLIVGVLGGVALAMGVIILEVGKESR